MPHCAVINCLNSTRVVSRVNGDVSYHKFPNDPILKEKWINATGNKISWFSSKHSKICSIHFNNDVFYGTSKRRLLLNSAIPTIDILQSMGEGENVDHKFSSNQASKNTPSKRKLEKDIDQSDTSNEEIPLNTPKKRKLIYRLNLAQKKLKQKDAEIKRLREQNRRKVNKILALVTLLECLKKKSFINDEQVNSLK